LQRRTFLAVSAATAAAPNLLLAQGAAAMNPLLQDWTGPYGGLPPFDKVKVEHFKPALEAAMDQHRAEIAAIAQKTAAPTFENTLAALEKSGRTLDRVGTVYGVFSGTLSTPAFRDVEKEMDPKLAAYSDEITQNAALFARIEAVYNARDKARLTPEQKRLAWKQWDTFVRAGAKLAPPAKKRIAEINQRLATLFVTFNENLLADEETFIPLAEAELAGLPDAIRADAASLAKDKKSDAPGVVVNTRSSVEPYLSYASNREARKKIWQAFVDRGDNGDAHDNNAIIKEILKLRAERAKLLGFPTHAHWRLENAMARTPEQAMALMDRVWGPSVQRVREEVADMQKIADSEGAKITIEPWDYRYYAEKVRVARYDLDMNLVKPYMQLDKMREAMFWSAGQLYGITFTKLSNIPVHQPDITVYEVKDAAGQHVGLWYFDPFARAGKRSGAWMNSYRAQEAFERPRAAIVSNNCNFVKAALSEPVLISWDDAVTLFHEFGHAIHGLMSKVSYPTLSGTNVARDYVEFPSQLNEHWLDTPQVLGQFAKHYKTGEVIPDALVKRIDAASKFNQGFATVEYLSSAIVDMKLHLTADTDIDVDTFERETLTAIGMPREIVMRHRLPQFGHLFSSDGYSAGYYSYLWADVLTADCAEAFEHAPGGYYDKGVAKRLREEIMSRGNTVDPADQFRAFRGRNPDPAALMRKRGFA